MDVNGEGVEDDYKLNKETGKITLLKKSKTDKFDRLYATNSKGEVQYNKSVKIDKAKPENSTIITELVKNKTTNNGRNVNYAVTSKIKDALNVFQFAAFNSKKEWSLEGSTLNGGTFVLGTYKSKSVSPIFSNKNFNLGLTIDNVKFDIHSHVGKLGTVGPSTSTNPKTPGDLQSNRTPKYNRYIYYNGKGRGTAKGTLFRYGNGYKTKNLGVFAPNNRSLTNRIKI